MVSPKGDNVEVPASEATKHWECQENTDGLKVCPKILLMEEIRLTTKDDDYPIVYRVLTISGGAGFLPSTVALRKEQN